MSKELPKPQGKYQVGTFTFTVYNDREETDFEAQGQMRSIASRVYYPVDPSSVENIKKSRYMSREMTNGLARTFFIPLNYDKSEKNGKNLSDCYENAPRIEGAGFPLIIFNHGYMSYREANSFLCIELASQGYVVISITHSYEAIMTELDDGTKIPMYKKLQKKMIQPFLRGFIEQYKLVRKKGTNEELARYVDEYQDKYGRFICDRVPEWEKDIMAVVDYAKKNLSDLIDFEKGIGATGHSMGGAVSYALCHDEKDFVCGINIDGALFGKHGDKIMDKPFLQLTSEHNVGVVTRGFLKHKKPAYHVIVKDMQHLGFSDMKHFIPIKSKVGSLDPDIAHEIVTKVHIAFFDAYLKGSGTEPKFPESENVRSLTIAPDTL